MAELEQKKLNIAISDIIVLFFMLPIILIENFLSFQVVGLDP